MTLFVLLVVGMLVATAFVLAFQDERAGRSLVRAAQAFGAAQAGAEQAVAAGLTKDTFSGVLVDGPGWYRVSVRRLGPSLFLVESQGYSADSAARQTVGLLVRRREPRVRIDAAILTARPARVSPGASVDGRDEAPPGWGDCPPPRAPLPEMRLGVASWPDLSKSVDKRLPAGSRWIGPSSADGVCATADPDNWGDPLTGGAPCADYLPVIRVQGELTLEGGWGQGLLLVDGGLSLRGGARFFGLVLVRDTLEVRGAGSQVIGAVVAGGAVLERGGVRYSSCAVRRALEAASRTELLGERSWLEMYR